MKTRKLEETTITPSTPSSDEEVEVIGRQRESRIGSDFQVDMDCIPNPTQKPSMLPEEYLDLESTKIDRSKVKGENDYSIYELVWDPNAAKRKSVEEFIDMYDVPSSHKEFALEALHKRNYNIDGFMEDLEEQTPLDGSDWSLREKTLFRELMMETKHDLQEVAEKMGKSFGNCLVVFYKTMANVQSERSKRSRRKTNDYSSLSDMSPSTKPPSTMNDGDSSKCSDTHIFNEKNTEINDHNDSELSLEKTQEDVNDDVLVTPSTRPSTNTNAVKDEPKQEFILTNNAARNITDNLMKGASGGTLKTAEIEASLSSNQSSTDSSEHCRSTTKQSPHASSIMDTNINENLENRSSSIQDTLLEKNDSENAKSDLKTLKNTIAEKSENNNDENTQSHLANLIKTKSCDAIDPDIKTNVEVHSISVPDDDDQSGKGDKGENESVSRRRSPRHLHTSKDALFDQINSTDRNTFSTLSKATATTRQQRYPRRSVVEYNLKEDDANKLFRKTRSHAKAGVKEELDEESLSSQKRYPSRSKRKSTDTDEGTFGKIKKQDVKHEKSTSSSSRRVSPRKLSATFDSKSRGMQLRQFRRNQRQSKLEANDRIHKLSSQSGEHPDQNREAKDRKRRSVVKAENNDSVQKETKPLQKVTTRSEDLARPKTNNTPEFEETFDHRLAELKEFYEKNGHGLVPKVYKNKKLSYWVFRLRSMENNRKSRYGRTKNRLTPWHKKLLKKYGFEFKAREKAFEFQRERMKEERDIAFNQKFERLVKFKKKHGHCIVPKRYPPDQPLSYWVFKSRQYRIAQETRGAQEMISQEQIERLDSIGFVWAAKKNSTWKKSERIRIRAVWDESWEKAYKKLLRFKKQHGHTNIPKKWPQDQHLASWCFRQKKLYKMDQDLEDGEILNLPAHRKEKLEKIGFNFHSTKKSPQKDTETESGDEGCDSFDSGKNVEFSRKMRSNCNGYKQEVGERKRKNNGRMTRISLSAATASNNKGAPDEEESKKNSIDKRKEGIGRKTKSMAPSTTSTGSKNENHDDDEEKVNEILANPEQQMRMTRNSLSTLARSPTASADENSDSIDQESEDEDVTENPAKRVRMTRNSLSTLAHSPITSADEHNVEESKDEDVAKNPATRNTLSTLAYSLFQASKSFLEK